ncbi:S41 family peptidase [Mesorhizobium amorphae]|uniref:S41 family peptidase n=1 Tax=Mesorhizobium amorphae TaxID=71433 RepID=UPI001642A1E7|nr:S41 family peptidase [Mesorhizobium amorphae]
MRARWLLSAVAVVCSAMTAQAANEIAADELVARVASRVEELIERNFYKPVDFPSFAGKHPTNADIDKALADLKASHTRRFMPGTLEYYEVADIYQRWLSRDLSSIFPPRGEVQYEGIGIATTVIDGKRFVTDVYDGAMAKTAGIQVGDEVLSVNSQPFDEIRSFKGGAGTIAIVTVRRAAKTQPVEIPVMVAAISPVRMFLEAVSASARIVDYAGRDIGYVRLWTVASPLTNETVETMLRSGLLSESDGLVLDLRGRWGGISSELPEMLMEDFADISFTMRNGRSFSQRETWRKPIVVLIDGGTRSANELLACAMKKRGFSLIGEKSAGAVLGGSAYVLPDDSLLMVATSMVRVDGEVLEGRGVEPDKIVSAPIPYAGGADPQLEVAMKEVSEQLSGVSSWRSSLSPEQRRCSQGSAARSN